MKKWMLRIVIVLVVLGALAVGGVLFFLNGIVKKGVETEGPAITKVEVKLGAVTIAPFSGSANIKNFFLGNPPGYKTDSAVKVEEVSIRLKPLSVLSDKVIIDSINVKTPEINFEGSLAANNLSKIQANINSFSGGTEGGKSAPEKGAGKKLQIGDFVLSGAKLHVTSPLLAGQTLSATLPDIHLTDLGAGSDGITPVELTGKVMSALMKEVIPAATKMISNLGGEAAKLGKGAAKQTGDTLKNASGGLKGLFSH